MVPFTADGDLAGEHLLGVGEGEDVLLAGPEVEGQAEPVARLAHREAARRRVGDLAGGLQVGLDDGLFLASPAW